MHRRSGDEAPLFVSLFRCSALCTGGPEIERRRSSAVRRSREDEALLSGDREKTKPSGRELAYASPSSSSGIRLKGDLQALEDLTYER